jgi:hypothetical protein
VQTSSDTLPIAFLTLTMTAPEQHEDLHPMPKAAPGKLKRIRSDVLKLGKISFFIGICRGEA